MRMISNQARFARRTWRRIGAGMALACAVALPLPAHAAHPRLITTEARFAELQARAQNSPWKEMRAAAIADATNLQYHSGEEVWPLWDILGAASLAYILDPPNRSAYIAAIQNALGFWPDILARMDPNDWVWTSPPGGAFFISVLALDVIHDALSPSDAAALEDTLRPVGEWWWSHGTAWELNLYGSRGIWAMYTEDRPRIDEAKKNYHDAVNAGITADGVFTGGSEYASWRLGVALAKAHFMDVLEFTGEDKYYTDPRVISFFEWLYGYAVTPFGRAWAFGDSAWSLSINEGHAASWRAGRFSQRAARLSAWANRGKTPHGRLLDYIFLEAPMPAPEVPTSRVFPDGGAWFRTTSDDPGALEGAIWNPKKDDIGHSHNEVNAVSIAAYGEHVLLNAGYNNYGGSSAGYPYWGWTADNALSGNTVVLGGENHQVKHGDGITEGFTGLELDYASGASGTALPNGQHQRNFVFVHPTGDADGYFVLLDEVKANAPGTSASVLLHANADSATVVTADTEVKWTIGPNTFSGHPVALSAFLATPPDATSIEDGGVGTFGDYQSFVSKYLKSDYRTGSDGRRRIATVLFPHDATHPKPSFARVGGSGWSGAKLTFARGAIDTVLEVAGDSLVDLEGGARVDGQGAIYRRSAAGTAFYFVPRGKRFEDGGTPRKGFESNNRVSVYMRGIEGLVTAAAAAEVTFYDASATGISIDGAPVASLGIGNGFVRVALPAGTHRIALTSSPNTGSGDAGASKDAGAPAPPGNGVGGGQNPGGPEQGSDAASDGCACRAAHGSRGRIALGALLAVLALTAFAARRRGAGARKQ